MKRILITGGSGFLGSNIAPPLALKHRLFLGCFRTPLSSLRQPAVSFDITDSAAVVGLIDRVRPDIVVHAAAMTKPDECERHPGEARRLIVGGTRHVARACRESGSRLVHISTDLVFDGKRGLYTEEDPAAGISVYARAKIDAEREALDQAPGSTVLRIALLFGRGTERNPGHVGLTLDSWRRGQALVFYTDQYRTPLFAPHLADVIEALLARPAFGGIVHVGGAERVSRFEFASLLARRAGVPQRLVVPGSMWDNPAAAPRGADCSLVSRRLECELGIKPLTCSEGLDRLAADGCLVLPA